VFAPIDVERVAHFSFGAWGADCSWELPRLLNSMRGRQAARKQLELAETSVPLAWEQAGLKGCWRLRMCQQAVSTLRATARTLRGSCSALDELAVVLVPGVGRSPGGVRGFDCGPAQRPRSALRPGQPAGSTFK
jgi:hypothetical protein